MRRLPILIPHRAGRADFPLPVLHGRASLTVVQMTLSVTRRQRKTRGRTVRPRFHSCQFSYPLSFRGQVCETPSSLPFFPSTVLCSGFILAQGKFHFEPPFTSFDHLVGAGEQRRRHL